MKHEEGVYRLLSFLSFFRDGVHHSVKEGTMIYAKLTSKRVMHLTVLEGPHKGVAIRSVTTGEPNTRKYLEPVTTPLLALAAVADGVDIE